MNLTSPLKVDMIKVYIKREAKTVCKILVGINIFKVLHSQVT